LTTEHAPRTRTLHTAHTTPRTAPHARAHCTTKRILRATPTSAYSTLPLLLPVYLPCLRFAERFTYRALRAVRYRRHLPARQCHQASGMARQNIAPQRSRAQAEKSFLRRFTAPLPHHTTACAPPTTTAAPLPAPLRPRHPPACTDVLARCPRSSADYARLRRGRRRMVRRIDITWATTPRARGRCQHTAIDMILLKTWCLALSTTTWRDNQQNWASSVGHR